MDKVTADKGRAFAVHVGNVISKWRVRHGYTQDNLGSDLGVSGRTVGKYENANLPVKASTMAEISHICDFDLIEYVLFDGSSAALKFKEIVDSGKIGQYSIRKTVKTEDYQYKDGATQDYVLDIDSDMKYQYQRFRRSHKLDILNEFPDIRPLPLCDEDIMEFEIHMASKDARNRLRILLYGHELMKLYESTNTPSRTKVSFARQLLKRIILTKYGDIDETVYAFYWKCYI
ncbi:MAG: hypothetical protein K5985_00175 [Lachnospiraceae bacterium]|nr:hypothetical protein [Lachnospiraceae bacterium]